MSEPEEVLIDAARHTTVAVARLWRRLDAGRAGAPVDCWLDDQRGRLELLLAAVHDVRIPVRTAQPPAPPSFLRRALGGRPGILIERTALPATDGSQIFLPRVLRDAGGLEASRWYRLIALQQAGRARRGTAGLRTLPAQGLARELYLLREAAAVDRQIARELPGLRSDLVVVRTMARTDRPAFDALTPSEQAIEALYRRHLAGRPEACDCLPAAAAPGDSWRWAQAAARSIEARCGQRFRGFLPDLWFGALLPPPSDAQQGTLPAAPEAAEAERPPSTRLPRKPRVRVHDEKDDDQDDGMWMVQMDDPLEHVEDPMGMNRPVDRGAGEKPEDSADSLSELPEAQLVATPEQAREIFVADDIPACGARLEPQTAGQGIRYPEWDHRIGAYHEAGVTVRVEACPVGDPAWAEQVMRRRRDLLDAVRRRFEGLQPRRIQLRRQRDGGELDLDAWVEAYAALRSGQGLPDRLYRISRPARRDLAVQLLVDVSGSTDAWVGEDQRIIDVEKEALLVCCHALDVLGDPYAIAAFSGEGPHGVRIWPLKEFQERETALVRRRIAALEPERHTRAGAALRHATAQLAQRREQHRLLLLLSDGKPNDVDVYEGRYGVEDMRQSVIEAAAAGIQVFCLTVDRDAPHYLGRIFGPGRHTTLRHARQLPVALVEVLRRLLST